MADENDVVDEDAEAASDSILPIDEHEEIVSEDGRKIRRRGVYLLPNLFTLGALFAGFYAVISGMSGQYNEAGWAIMIAAICDGLDGRIARLTNTQSAFGAQFDSLSDMVSFGMAPAIIMFSWAFGALGQVGWAASFIYMSCAALRLARYNVQLGTVDKRFFVGLQSPVAAGLVAFVPWVGFRYGVAVTPLISYLAAVLTVFTGLLMISNYRYFSFKELNFKGTVPYMVFIFTVILLIVIAQNPHEMLLGMCVLYAFSGPVGWVYRKQFNKSSPAVASAEPEGEEDSWPKRQADRPKKAVKKAMAKVARIRPRKKKADPQEEKREDEPSAIEQAEAGADATAQAADSTDGAGSAGLKLKMPRRKTRRTSRKSKASSKSTKTRDESAT